MGKKNFTEGYNPFERQIQQDEARLAALAKSGGRPPATEVGKGPSATPEVAASPGPVAPPAAAPAFVERVQTRPNLDLDDEQETVVAPPPNRQPKAPSPPPSRTASSAQTRQAAATQPLVQGQSDADMNEVSPRLKVSQAAFQDLETCLGNVYRSTGSQVHYSIATRALWGLLVQAEAQVQEELRKHPLGRLPSTRDRLAYAAYEERVKQVFGLAFRKLPRSLFQPTTPQDETTEP